MNEPETRETLIAICESLKGQYISLGSLERSFHLLFQVIEHYHPDAGEQYDAVASKALWQENPATRERIEQLDALLQQLKKK